MIFWERFQEAIEGISQQKLYASKYVNAFYFTILQTSTSVRYKRITAAPMLSVTTLKALTFVHANQDISETALTAQVK